MYSLFSFFIFFSIIKIKFIQKIIFIFIILISTIFIDNLNNNKIYKRIYLDTLNAFNLHSPNDSEINYDLLNNNVIPIFFYECYKFSYKNFLNNKYFGIGPKISRELYALEKEKNLHKKEYERYTPCVSHPHNIYVQLFLETGIIGAIPVAIRF